MLELILESLHVSKHAHQADCRSELQTTLIQNCRALPDAFSSCQKTAQMHQVWNDAGIAVHKLAKLYKELADTDRAAQFYTFHLKRLDEEQSQGQDVAEALEFLATWNKVMPGSHLQQGVVRICVACDFVAHACSSLKSNDGAAYVTLAIAGQCSCCATLSDALSTSCSTFHNTNTFCADLTL